MCLAIPAEVIEVLNSEQARVSICGVEKVVQTQLVENPQVGDFLLIHVGMALTIIDRKEAQETLTLIENIQSLDLSKD